MPWGYRGGATAWGGSRRLGAGRLCPFSVQMRNRGPVLSWLLHPSPSAGRPGALLLLPERVSAGGTELGPGQGTGEGFEVGTPTHARPLSWRTDGKGWGEQAEADGEDLARLDVGPFLQAGPKLSLCHPASLPSLWLSPWARVPGSFGFGSSFRAREYQGGSGQSVSWLARVCSLSKQERVSSLGTMGPGQARVAGVQALFLSSVCSQSTWG